MSDDKKNDGPDFTKMPSFAGYVLDEKGDSPVLPRFDQERESEPGIPDPPKLAYKPPTPRLADDSEEVDPPFVKNLRTTPELSKEPKSLIGGTKRGWERGDLGVQFGKGRDL